MFSCAKKAFENQKALLLLKDASGTSVSLRQAAINPSTVISNSFLPEGGLNGALPGE